MSDIACLHQLAKLTIVLCQQLALILVWVVY